MDREATRPLPSGLLTFLFTDVVDSTALWERAPGLMDSALSRHDELIEASIEAHGGILLKHRGEGDSTFCVFDRAPEAVAAAIDIQRRLADETWDPATPMRVRMGLHSGESILRGRDYYGRTINRAARVRAVANGGQVLLSSTSAELVAGELPEDTEIRFLRREVLRGIDRVEAIHELVDLLRKPEEAPVVAEWEQAALQPEVDVGVHRSFSGRDDTMALIASTRKRAGPDGPLQLLLLHGPPGVGKSTIACAAARQAHSEGWTALFGACTEHVKASFEPFRQVLNYFVDIAPMHVIAAHVTEHGGEVGRLTPRLAARVGALPPVDALDPETTRQLLIEAVADLLLRAAREQPLLLVLDSLHWADRGTLAVVELLTRSGTDPLVIICTNETNDAGVLDSGSVASDLRSLPTVMAIEIHPFSAAEVTEIIDRAAGHPLGEEGVLLAQHLVDETGGNPLFVAELLRYFVELKVVTSDDQGRWSVAVPPSTVPTPPSVRAVIQQRLDRLGDDTNKALGLASVAGRTFESGIVAGILDTDEVTVIDALEQAASASIVHEVGVGQFEFSSPLLRQTLYDDLGATRRGLWHRSIALALEERNDVKPGLLAYHWTSTGRDERINVVKWAFRAGVAALADLAPESAINWLRTALEAVADDDAQRLEILIHLGDAQRWAEADAFRQTLLDAAALAEELGDDAALIRAALANNRGGASHAGEVDDERVAVLERALAVRSDDSTDRARLLATLAIELSQGPDLERRIDVSDEAVAIARRSGDDFALVQVLLLTLEANRVPATLEQRKVDTDELWTLAVQVGDPVVIAIAALRSLRAKFESAAFDEADGLIETLDEYARFDPYVLTNLATVQAVLAHARGELDKAVELADAALDASRSERDSLAVHLSTTSMIRRERGTLGELAPTLEQIVDNYPGVTGFHPLLGLALEEAGRRDEAESLLQHEIDTNLSDHPMNPLWMASVSMVALLAIELESEEAARMLIPVLGRWRGLPCTSVVSYNGLVNEILGFLSLVTSDLDQASNDFEAAIEQAERIGARVSLVRSRLGRARVLAAGEEHDRALSEARVVEQEAEAIGMTVVVEQARRLVDELASGEVVPG